MRYHGVFANRSRMRRLVPPAPAREWQGLGMERSPGRDPQELGIERAEHPASPVREVPQAGSGPQAAKPSPSASRRRLPWAQLLRRALHVDALSCPKCSTSLRSVPMIVLAFLTDRAVVERILRHLGLPHEAPALAPARRLASQLLLDPRALGSASADLGVCCVEEAARDCAEEGTGRAGEGGSWVIRPPP